MKAARPPGRSTAKDFCTASPSTMSKTPSQLLTTPAKSWALANNSTSPFRFERMASMKVAYIDRFGIPKSYNTAICRTRVRRRALLVDVAAASVNAPIGGCAPGSTGRRPFRWCSVSFELTEPTECLRLMRQ
jgi:hypothetical protein